MLCGHTPFQFASTIDSVLDQVMSPHPASLSLPPVIASSVPVAASSLTCALLTRDPAARISFADFFAHPYIDVEHLPGPDSLRKGMENIVQAVELDERVGEVGEGREEAAEKIDLAVELYVEGVAHLLAHSQYVGGAATVTERATAYIDRAETLKAKACLLRSGVPDIRRGFSSAAAGPDAGRPKRVRGWVGGLMEDIVWGSVSAMRSTFTSAGPASPPGNDDADAAAIADEAERILQDAAGYDAVGDKAALDRYDEGLAMLLRAVSIARDRAVRDRLRAQACTWFDRAEAAKDRQRSGGGAITAAGPQSSGSAGAPWVPPRSPPRVPLGLDQQPQPAPRAPGSPRSNSAALDLRSLPFPTAAHQLSPPPLSPRSTEFTQAATTRPVTGPQVFRGSRINIVYESRLGSAPRG
ncbi:hypothetical protein BDK51DRAFT_29042 [Blyttiomyces helicus]|uniref:MIT domain-containing protein n=1 Tax=Blyttiomyces helicus TaxID=388810 RepID=A0A4P9WHM2_9FUNG|nr:hypothetical protein BDK51DRAFT_29042 [Blyttiomyces helicus]|eukprot:RKO90600.1 hypothetical protein BDK51DRAFT_29042 [Blyttiomyces helicus]